MLVLAPLVVRGHGLAVRTSRLEPRLRRRGLKHRGLKQREQSMDLAVSAFAVYCSLSLTGRGYSPVHRGWRHRFYESKDTPYQGQARPRRRHAKQVYEASKEGLGKGWGYTIFTLIAEGFKGAASAPTRAAGTLFTICHRVLFLLFSQAIPELRLTLMYAL